MKQDSLMSFKEWDLPRVRRLGLGQSFNQRFKLTNIYMCNTNNCLMLFFCFYLIAYANWQFGDTEQFYLHSLEIENP